MFDEEEEGDFDYGNLDCGCCTCCGCMCDWYCSDCQENHAWYKICPEYEIEEIDV